MAVTGNLKDMGLTALITVNCNERHQARLLIKNEGQEAAIFFEDGNIAHMTLGSQEGEEVIYELLSWEDGDFQLDLDVPAPQHSVTTGWSGLLLEGMRRVDEDGDQWNASELDLEVEAKVEDQQNERIAKALKRIDGIEGVLISTLQGEVLEEESNANPAKEAALTAFIAHRAEALREILNDDQVKLIALSGKDRKTVVVPQGQQYYSLSFPAKFSPEVMASAALITLRRYQ